MHTRVFNTWFLGRPEIVEFWGLAGPGGWENPSKIDDFRSVAILSQAGPCLAWCPFGCALPLSDHPVHLIRQMLRRYFLEKLAERRSRAAAAMFSPRMPTAPSLRCPPCSQAGRPRCSGPGAFICSATGSPAVAPISPLMLRRQPATSFPRTLRGRPFRLASWPMLPNIRGPLRMRLSPLLRVRDAISVWPRLPLHPFPPVWATSLHSGRLRFAASAGLSSSSQTC